MTGAYLRVKNNEGKFVSVEVEHLTDDERLKIFKDRPPEELIRWMNLLCHTLSTAEMIIIGNDDLTINSDV